MMRQLLDIMHQAIEFPLSIYLASATQGKTIQPLVAPDIAEHRFHGGEAAGDHFLALGAVDFHLHPVGVGLESRRPSEDERYLAGSGLFGGAQALRA